MKDHTVLLSSLKYIDEDVFAEIKNYTISSNDLYLTIAGTIGDVGLVPAELDGANLTENAAKLTDIKCSKQYLMYVLMSSIAQDHFCSRFHQVAQPKLSLETASSTLIPLPPYREQLRIAGELDRWLGVVVSVEDDLSELTNYVRKIKSKILDLAISGKLVPQDPADEPAIELLKRINPNFVPCDNSHYENVPEGWTICKISDLCKIENGFAFSSDDYKTSGIPLIRISNITNNTIDLSDCVYIENIEINDKYIISKGDLLIAMSGATTGKMGVYKNNNISFLNQRVCNVKIIDNSVLVHSYRNYFLQSKVSEILTLAYGGAQPNISTTMIGNFEILLPPYNEQERIVSTIEFIFTQINTITAEL